MVMIKIIYRLMKLVIKIICRLMKLVASLQTIQIQTIALCLGLGGYWGGRRGDTIPIVKPLGVSLAEEKVSPMLCRGWVGVDTYYQQVYIFTH